MILPVATKTSLCSASAQPATQLDTSEACRCEKSLATLQYFLDSRHTPWPGLLAHVRLDCVLVQMSNMQRRNELIYLDNASTTFPKPCEVVESVRRYMTEVGANPGRGGYSLVVQAQAIAEDARQRVANLIGAGTPDRVVFTASCTDALNIAIKGVLNAGDHVVTTMLEHNSVSRPLESLRRDGVVDVTRVGFHESGVVDPDEIAMAINPRTKLIVLTHASNVTGAIQPVAQVGALARKHGALFLLDSAQTIGLLDVNVEKFNVDLLAFPVHKAIFAPPGLGILYVGERAEVRPWREGGTGMDSVNPLQPCDLPERLEAGTFNGLAIAGLQAALTVLKPAETLAHERRLTQMIVDKIGPDDRFRVYGPTDPAARVGTISVSINGYAASEVATILDQQYKIAVRAGLHCAPYAHRQLGTFPDGLIRFAPGPFNTEDELEESCAALTEIAAHALS